ncbi:MAG: WYL domain-containing protein [Actinomycetota bacterium]|nr:WYL domain-containing protein [Actinomycetota bacterium]
MSESGPRLSRLMTMVPWLLAHDGVSVDEAADHFGISVEQCEKDLWLLVVCGLPGHGPDQLVDIQFWDDGRIHVIDPQTLDRPLRLGGDEIMSLLVALRLLLQVPGTHDRATLHRVIARLEIALGAPQASAGLMVESGVTSVVLDAIESALAEHRSLRIVYAARTDDAVTERVVHPTQIVTTDGRLYLEGYCERAEAVRTFRVDRILSAQLGDADIPAVHPSAVASAALVARVRISPSSRWALDVYPLTQVAIGPEGHFEADLAYQDLGWLSRVVLSLAGEMQVLSPDEARVWVADSALEALASYS